MSLKSIPMVSLILRYVVLDTFSTQIVANNELGMYKGRLSKVRIIVNLQPINSTMP